MIRVVPAVLVPLVALALCAGGSVAYQAVTAHPQGVQAGSGPVGPDVDARPDSDEEDSGQGNVPTALSFGYLTAVLTSLRGQLLSEIVFSPETATAKSYGAKGAEYISWKFDKSGRGTQEYSSKLPIRMTGYGTFRASGVRADVVYATVLEALDLSAADGGRANSLAQAATGLRIEYDHDWHADVRDVKDALITVTVNDSAAGGKPRAYCWTADGKERREPQS